MRQWHQKRPGWNSPMPVQAAYGNSHISGVSGFMPSQLYTPSTASQNLPQEAMDVTPPRACICREGSGCREGLTAAQIMQGAVQIVLASACSIRHASRCQLGGAEMHPYLQHAGEAS